MEFFIALFGGLFLLARFVIRKTDENGIRNADSKWEAVRRPIAESLEANGEDDRAVEEMESWGAEDLYAYLGEDLAEIFGPDYRKIVPFDKKEYRNFRNVYGPYTYRRNRTVFTREAYITYWITHILYSKRGKLKSLHSPFGLNVCVGNQETNIRMCRRIEKNLRAHGVDVHLMLATEIWSYDHGKEHLTRKVEAKEAQHRYWKGRELDAIRELRTTHPEFP